MKSLLKFLEMLVKKKKKRKKGYSCHPVKQKKQNFYFKKKSIKCGTAMLTSIDRNCPEF